MMSSLGRSEKIAPSASDPADQVAERQARHDLGTLKPRLAHQVFRLPDGKGALHRGPPIQPADIVEQQHAGAEPRKPVAQPAAREILDDDPLLCLVRSIPEKSNGVLFVQVM